MLCHFVQAFEGFVKCGAHARICAVHDSQIHDLSTCAFIYELEKPLSACHGHGSLKTDAADDVQSRCVRADCVGFAQLARATHDTRVPKR